MVPATGPAIRGMLILDHGCGIAVRQRQRDLLAIGGGEIDWSGAFGARNPEHEKTRERLAIRAAQIAAVSHDERCLRWGRRNLDEAERRRSFWIEMARAGESLFFLVMPDRRAQRRARLAVHFPIKQMTFAKLFLGFANLFIPIKGAAGKQKRNYNQ